MKEKWYRPTTASGWLALAIFAAWVSFVVAFILFGLNDGGGSCFYDCG